MGAEEVRWDKGMEGFVGEQEKFVINARLDRKPVEVN